MSDDQNPTTDEDEWWERVFCMKEALQHERACEGICMTFTCLCQKDAIAQIHAETGVCFADQE